MADVHDFSITIIGHEQGIDASQKSGGPPIVLCPKSDNHQPNGYVMDQLSEHCFFVVIQNRLPVPAAITMNCSGWYEALQFKMTDSSGKVYNIKHGLISWSANPLLTWNFASGGIRNMPVDFTNGAMTGWQGMPPAPSSPKIVTMTATFTYGDTPGKLISVSSKPTDVELHPGN